MSAGTTDGCPRCGLTRKPTVRFCKRCGERIAGEPASWHVHIGTGTPSAAALRQLLDGTEVVVEEPLEPPDPRDPCERCGQALRKRARFCPRCGAARTGSA